MHLRTFRVKYIFNNNVLKISAHKISDWSFHIKHFFNSMSLCFVFLTVEIHKNKNSFNFQGDTLSFFFFFVVLF